MIPSNVQNAIDNGYEFRFGDYISDGFRIVQKNLGLFIAAALVMLIILFGASLVSGAIGAGLMILGGIAGVFANQLLSQVVNSALIGPLSAGMYHSAQKTDSNKSVEFGDFFAGFSKFMPLFVTTVMTSLIVFLSMLPGIYLMLQGGLDISALSTPMGFQQLEDLDFGNIALGGLVAFIPAIYLSVSYMWAPMLTWFYGISGWEALETSRKLVGKNFLLLFGFLIVIALIAGLGIILLCIGLLFTFPVYLASNYAAFADVVGLNRSSTEADTLDHFMPNSGI